MTLGHQYGAGPTYQSWYGIAIIVHLLGWKWINPATETERKHPLATTFAGLVFYYVAAVMIIGCVHLTRAMLGWQ